jgi:hypothetical protein
VQRVRAEFDEAPGLDITVDQGVRFWALDTETCEHVLTRFHEMGFLLKTHDGHYRRRTVWGVASGKLIAAEWNLFSSAATIDPRAALPGARSITPKHRQ